MRALFLALALWSPSVVFQATDPAAEIQRLNQEGITALEARDFPTAIAAFKEVIELDPGNATAPYNLACAYALQGDSEQALEWLGKAVQAGYDDYFWAMADSDLASLRDHPGLAEVLRPIEPKEAPDFVLKDLEGRDVRLSDFRGKVVLVDFWGTWCGWCIKELPHLKKLYARYQDRGFVILGLAYESGSPDQVKQKLRQFVADKGVEYPILIGDDVTKEAFGGIEGFPTTFAITHDGRIYTKVVGYREGAFFEGLVERLMDLKDRSGSDAGADEALERGLTQVGDGNPTVRWRGVEALATCGRVEALEALIGLLGDPVPWIREGSIARLRALTGQEFGYVFDGPEANRQESQGLWKAWYDANQDSLVYDRQEHRFLKLR